MRRITPPRISVNNSILWTISGLALAACGGGGSGGSNRVTVNARYTGLPSEISLYEGENILPVFGVEYSPFSSQGVNFAAGSYQYPSLEVTIDSQERVSIAPFTANISGITASSISNGITLSLTINTLTVNYSGINNIAASRILDALENDASASVSALSVTLRASGGSIPTTSQTYTGSPKPDGSIDVFIGSFGGQQINQTISLDPNDDSSASLFNLSFSNTPRINIITEPSEANNHVGVTSADGTVDHTGEELTANIDGYSAYYTANGTPTATGYQWYMNGTAIQDATNQTYTPTEAGSYYVEVVVSVGNNEITIPSRPFTLTAPQQGAITDGSDADNKALSDSGSVADEGFVADEPAPDII